MPLLLPDLVWRGGAFHEGEAVDVDPSTGRIRAVIEAHDVGRTTDRPLRLPKRALLPGFVNGHSHAFQRLLRGHAQGRGAEGNADFWSWRDAMYSVALGLSPEDVYDASRFCFIEMMRAGYTSVGEFHYLHRDEQGRAYHDPTELARRVISAAEDAGMRICLLNVAYAAGGIRRPLEATQRRFATPDLEHFLLETADLAEAMTLRPLVSVGLAPHSIRAVPRSWLPSLHSLAYGMDLPIHMHVSEQPAEVAACLDAWGQRPVEILADYGMLDSLFTAVHATHLTFREIEMLALPGPVVCACPTTERDLGDGFLAAAELHEAGATIALGSDSQIVIAPLEEMRLIEYHERLRKQKRVVLTGQGPEGTHEVGPALIAMGTAAGARSLRIDAGRIEPGALADLVAVDLDHLALVGWTRTTLAALLSLAAPADVVSDVWVSGVHRVEGRYHPQEMDAAVAFRRVARRFTPDVPAPAPREEVVA